MEEREQFGNLGFINVVVLFEAGESSGIRNTRTRPLGTFTVGRGIEKGGIIEESLKISWENQKNVRPCK